MKPSVFAMVLFAHAAVASAQPVWETFNKSIVKILDKDRNTVGTGLVTGTSNGAVYILTARHVADQAGPNALVRFYEGQVEPLPANSGPRSDLDVDLAILIVKGTPTLPAPTEFARIRLGNSAALAVGVPVTTIGHPLDESWLPAINNEIQRDRIGTDLRKFGFKNTSIDSGNSGGPIFLADGTLIGIVQQRNAVYAVGFRIDQIYPLLTKVWHVPVNYLELEPDRDLVKAKSALYKEKNLAVALAAFRAAADRGDPEAQGYLCEMYRSGMGTAADPAKALPWCEKAAQAGDTMGMTGYGRLLDLGIAPSQNRAVSAVQWYTKAADRGSLEAKTQWAAHLVEGWGVAQDTDRAIRLLKSASDAGYLDATNRLGVIYYNGQGAPVDYLLALEYFRKASSGGDMTATANLGLLYEFGRAGLTKDPVKAFELYKKAADANDDSGMYRVALAYAGGTGVRVNDALAVQWLQKSADAGRIDATTELGRRLWYGVGVAANPAAAITYFLKAAETGRPSARVAMYLLSQMYRQGEGATKDTAAADRWRMSAALAGHPQASYEVAELTTNPAAKANYYRQAAEGGVVDAMVTYGVCLWNGTGVPQDYTKAVEWFTKASQGRRGNAAAMFNMGLALENGFGVPKADHAVACDWYRKSALKSFGRAQVAYGDCLAESDPAEALKKYQAAAATGVDGAKEKAEKLSAKLSVASPPAAPVVLQPSTPNSAPTSSNTSASKKVDTPLLNSSAAIVVYVYGVKGLHEKPSVFLDGVELARIRGGSWFATRSGLGEHRFCVERSNDNCYRAEFTENRPYVMFVENKGMVHYTVGYSKWQTRSKIDSLRPIDSGLVKSPKFVFFPK